MQEICTVYLCMCMFLMNFFVLYQQLILLVNTFLSNVVHFPFPLSTVVGEKDFHGVMFMREREGAM